MTTTAAERAAASDAAAVIEEAERIVRRVAEVRERGPFLLPAIYTPALSERFVSDGPALRRFVAAAWKTPEYPDGIKLDHWQAWLIDRVLERYPADHPDPAKAGRLRFRQCVISIPRQNGKSVLGAIFALYGLLMHEPGPIVVGVASSELQARIVYGRVLYVIKSNPDLARRFEKMTETRGIRTKGGAGEYQIKASKGDAVQGLPASLNVCDELHIMKPPVWNGLVQGNKTRRDGMTLGITTAGDDDSELLKHLYGEGEKSADLDPRRERFGFFCYHAPEAVIPDDDADLAEALLLANPSMYEGRVDVMIDLAAARVTPAPDVIRYSLNRFVASQNVFIPTERWIRSYRGVGEPFPDGRPFFAVDRTPDWSWATITASIRIDDVVHTEIVASIERPTLEGLADVCAELSHWDPIVYAFDGYSLRDLAHELERRGLSSRVATQGDMLTASSLLYSRVIRSTVKHSGDELLARQIPHTFRKNVGDGFRISRKDSAASIDAVISTALGIWAAETTSEPELQLF